MKNLLTKITLATALCVAATTAQAYSVSCIGYDSAGKNVVAKFNTKAYPLLSINSDTLKYAGRSKNKTGYVTEGFLNVNGAFVYDSIQFEKGGVRIYQFNKVTRKLLGNARLTCKKTK